MKVINILFFIFVFNAVDGYCQDNPYEIEKYPFVKNEINQFTIFDSTNYITFFEKLNQISIGYDKKISILHIGDSHIQADFLSGNFRKKLHSFFPGSIGGRGFIFPYKTAKTNNPVNYKVTSTGNWENCRNVQKNAPMPMGLSGITIFTSDSLATIKVNINDKDFAGYSSDKLMVFHDLSTNSYTPQIENAAKISQKKEDGYTLFEFNEPITEIKLSLRKTNSSQNQFNLYGFNFDSNNSGIIYHTVGVNGAEFKSFLRCEYFKKHLQALNPDLIIISLGTNDAYTNKFDENLFESRVDSLIKTAIKTSPQAAILLTTPADHRYKKEYINKNVLIASQIIKAKTKEYGLSFWDFREIMGGEGAINYWHYEKLSHTDFLHFSKKGYEYKAKLLFNAFLKSYDKYLEQN